MRLLLVEDHPTLAQSIAWGLQEAGYAVDTAHDGEEGLLCAQTHTYDAILLDLMLPKLDGLSVLKAIRAKGSQVPVLVLTARDAIPDRVQGLDHGADDYLVKPFSFEELKARVRALIRRGYQQPSNTVVLGDLELDVRGRKVRRAGKTVELSAREFMLLEYLAARRGQIVTRAEIVDHLYDFADGPSSNVVDVYVGYLRRKIDDGHATKLIRTHRGMGYSLGEIE